MCIRYKSKSEIYIFRILTYECDNHANLHRDMHSDIIWNALLLLFGRVSFLVSMSHFSAHFQRITQTRHQVASNQARV